MRHRLRFTFEGADVKPWKFNYRWQKIKWRPHGGPHKLLTLHLGPLCFCLTIENLGIEEGPK